MKFTTTSLLIWLVVCLPIPSLSQSDAEPIRKLIRNVRFQEAQIEAQKILDGSDPESDIYGEALYYRGVARFNLQDMEGAKKDFEKGLELKNSSHEAFFWKGLAMLQHELLDYDSAIYYYENALNVADRTEPFFIQLLIDKGFLLIGKQKYEAASKLYFQAREIYDEQNIKSPEIEEAVYGAIGDYYLIKKDYKNAEINLQYALDIAEQIYAPDHPIVASLHQSLGKVYIGLEDKEKMLYHFEAEYEIKKVGKEKGSFDLIVANNSMGMSLLNARNLESALVYLNEAYADITTYFPTFDIGVHAVSMNLGITYYLSKRYDEAKKYLHQAVDLGNKALGGKSQSVAEALGYLCFSYEDSGDLQAALPLYNDAIQTLALFKPNETLNANTETVDLLTMSFILQNRAVLYLKLFLEDPNPSYLELAKKDAQMNLDMLHNYQETFSTDSRSSISYELGNAYYAATEVDYYLYQETGDITYLERFLNHSERKKSDYLRTSLNFEEAKDFANIPDTLLSLEKDLKIQKEELKAKIIKAENSGEETIPWDSLLLVENRLDSLTDKLLTYVDPPEIYQWKDFKSLQDQLGRDEAIMEIHLQEDLIITLLISSKNVLVKRDSAVNLTDQIVTFRDEIQAVSEDFTTRTELSEILLENLSELPGEITKLTIVRDGALHYLPFELLDFDGKYLLETYDITYVNYIKEKEPSKIRSNNLLLSYAPEFGTDNLASLDAVRSDLTSIPGAFGEVRSIESFFEGETLTSTLATETSFKSKAKDFGIIHLATHAIVDDANPEISRLAFNISGDSLNDGYLHAYEIFNMEIPADLVTLSACNTGYGKIERGEGVMSLSWAFAYAGVPSTVVSLWPASDKSTPELMKYFYANLKEGQPKDVALNNARKEYLKSATGKARHPFYWGGFVLIGDNSPLEDSRNLLVYLLPSVLIIVMILTVYRRKKNTAKAS